MLEIFFAMMAAGLGAVGEAPPSQAVPLQTPPQQSAALTAEGYDMSVVPAGLIAEPQTATGKFTTAQEVKPILTATKGNWIAVREYDGRDLLYVTHLWAWRCGLSAVAVSVNEAPFVDWPLPPCHMKYATPNAVLEEDGLPYSTWDLATVATVSVQVVYDDLTMDIATFERGSVLIP
jgi:hypothetical protein